MSKSKILRNTLSTIAALFLIPFIISGFYYSQPLEALSVASSVVIVLFVVFTWFAKSKKLPLLLIVTQWGIISLLGVFILSLLAGAVFDVYGATCIGFFGAQVSCLENITFPARIFILSPFVLVVVAMLSLASTAQYLMGNNKPKKATR